MQTFLLGSVGQKVYSNSLYSKNSPRSSWARALYTDIYEDGMVERVKSSDEAAGAYYDEQDAEKMKEKYDGGK